MTEADSNTTAPPQPAATGQGGSPTHVYVGASAVAPAGNGLATASMVLGIIAIAIVWIPIIGMIGSLLALVGLVLGFVALQKPTGRGQAIAGIACSAVALAITILGWLAFGAILGAAASAGG